MGHGADLVNVVQNLGHKTETVQYLLLAVSQLRLGTSQDKGLILSLIHI